MSKKIKIGLIAAAFAVLIAAGLVLLYRSRTSSLKIIKKETVDGYQRLYVYSEQMKDTYAIDIVLPENYTKDRKCPVLYMTDGNWRRENYPEIMEMSKNGEICDVILVGIGYPDDYDVNSIRFRDLIDFPEDFLSFIVDDVMPYVEKNYRVDTDDRTLWGASCGGYFGLYALFQADDVTKDLFKNYLIVSPALMYRTDGKQINQFENEYYGRAKELSANVYLAVGGDEDSEFLDPFEPFAKKLDARGYDGLWVQYQVYPGLEHQTVWKPALMDFVREIYQTEEKK